MTASTLLPILCISSKFTTTSCSKVPQGLRFPLGVSGLFTGRYFQKAPIRDSDNLVKPFMQVTIQMTRYYVHNCYSHICEGFDISANLFMSPWRSDYIFLQTFSKVCGLAYSLWGFFLLIISKSFLLIVRNLRFLLFQVLKYSRSFQHIARFW